MITPTVFWSSYNNLLENTLTIFTSLSVWFYLIAQEKRRFMFIILAGLMLTLGFLTKGFVAFFPFSFPFLLWIFLRRISFGRMVSDTAGIVIFSLLPLIIMILLFPVVKTNLLKYFDSQVVGSIKNVVTVNSRFYVVQRMFSDLVFPASLSILFLLWRHFRSSVSIILKENIRKSLVFASLGLTGVLPVMISLKQSGFYILTTYPFFAISIAILVYPYLESLLTELDYKSKGFIFFKWIAYAMFVVGIILSISFSNHFSRDKNRIKDLDQIITSIPRGTIINIRPEMRSDWALHAYLGRFDDISLDPDLNTGREYLLIMNEYYSDTLNKKYSIVNLKTTDFKLFKKISK